MEGLLLWVKIDVLGMGLIILGEQSRLTRMETLYGIGLIIFQAVTNFFDQ